MNKYVTEFFENHPTENEVHVVDTSVLFLKKEYANTYAKGNEDAVGSFTREQYEAFKKEEKPGNTGGSGITDQQSNDNSNADGTEANASPSDLPKTETDQNTGSGNVINSDPGDEQDHVDQQD